ncbi:glycosyltransferase family 2 protein [Actinoplanes sp. TBRC 11911]|uniref:glycosyltransferase family 2 protein n=1 Tax=Actinoplanes sp. TBRC 11911 TaxID=2729386 RepID=UPI00145E23D6|nr:glycosyltransferase family 2 protein [Actinoplanes sp. TBRC 11911]NMO57803.1 glycosyltransferase family 2 protein [Actinoplanes sp. TBRC 11911]
MISVVIPAHNESLVIGRLLRALLEGARPGEIQVIVVPNGCTDDTAGVAASFGPAVEVVALEQPGKYAALRAGDDRATGDEVIFLDADVELGIADLRALAAGLREPGVLATAPDRTVDTGRSSWLVRWYYDIWQELPGVREGLFGRGVIAVGPVARERLRAVPDVMGDDLAASVAFAPAERRVVPGARVVVHAPRTLGDLLRRRVRSVTATTQLQAAMPGTVDAARTSKADLLGIVRRHPPAAPKLAAFLAVTVITRWRARRPIRSGDFTTWLRDESSRAT